MEAHPLAGKKIDMNILGIAGWLPSSLGVKMSPLFADYVKQRYGYDVTFGFAEAPFSDLFQKAATSLATKSQEYNIIISDSQWLGALAKPGWILKLNDIIAKNKGLQLDWYSQTVIDTYMRYPDGSQDIWGLPQEGDTKALYVRKDLVEDPKEQQAFQAKYNMKLPSTFEDYENLNADDYEKVMEFFTRPDKGLWGAAWQYSRVYDFCTCPLFSIMWSSGGADLGCQDRPGRGRAEHGRQRQGDGALQVLAEVHAAGRHQLRHRRRDRRLHAGQGRDLPAMGGGRPRHDHAREQGQGPGRAAAEVRRQGRPRSASTAWAASPG